MTVPVDPDLTIRLDVSRGGIYISAECQLGAHHGCPGGLRGDGRERALICYCREEACACNRSRNPT